MAAGGCRRSLRARQQQQSYRQNASGEFEAGDGTGAGEEEADGQQRWRPRLRARQRTLARAWQTQAVSTGKVRGSSAAFDRRECTFLLDEGLEEDVGQRKNSRRPRLEARDPAGGCTRGVAAQSWAHLCALAAAARAPDGGCAEVPLEVTTSSALLSSDLLLEAA